MTPVVIHSIPAERLDPPRIARLKAEWAQLSLIDHPNLARIVDFGESDGRLFTVSEFLPGRSVAAIARRLDSLGAGFPLHSLLRVLAQAAQGLDAAHVASGQAPPLGHGSLSEHDIVVGFGGEVKVFGLGLPVRDRPTVESRPAADLRCLRAILSRYLASPQPTDAVPPSVVFARALAREAAALGVFNAGEFGHALRQHLIKTPMPARPLGAFVASLFEADADLPHATAAFLSVESRGGAREARERRIVQHRVGRIDFEAFRPTSSIPPADPGERLTLHAEAQARFERGLAMVKSRDWAGALEEWERALELDSGNRLYQFNLRRLREIAGFQENR